MIVFTRPEEIETWFVTFHRDCISPFWNRWTPGRFKHVRAFAYSADALCWVFYDVAMSGTRVILAPAGAEADRLIGEYIAGGSVLKMRRLPPRKPRWRDRVGFWCVPAMRHLLNLPGGALLPEGLWRDCIHSGAEVVINGSLTPASRPDAGCGAEASAGG